MTISDYRLLLLSLLADDYGITETAFKKLTRMINETVSDAGELSDILESVNRAPLWQGEEVRVYLTRESVANLTHG